MMINDINAMKDEEFLNYICKEYVVSYYIEQKTEHHNTRCVKCLSNCHIKCHLTETKQIGN
jgi:hypothetical protein